MLLPYHYRESSQEQHTTGSTEEQPPTSEAQAATPQATGTYSPTQTPSDASHIAAALAEESPTSSACSLGRLEQATTGLREETSAGLDWGTYSCSCGHRRGERERREGKGGRREGREGGGREERRRRERTLNGCIRVASSIGCNESKWIHQH